MCWMVLNQEGPGSRCSQRCCRREITPVHPRKEGGFDANKKWKPMQGDVEAREPCDLFMLVYPGCRQGDGL